MHITKLFLQHFGKYHKRELELQKGINLIYGPNEAGKTTIKDFVIGMFYGIERLRGVAARTDEYVRREPFDGTGYAGSMELQKDGETYLIDRVFQKDQKSCQVYQQKTGRELDLSGSQSLYGSLIEMDKNTYANTLCISSQGAAYKQELQEHFRQYLMNINETKADNLNLKDAYSYLQNQKKALNRKGLDSELQTINRKLAEVKLGESLEALGKEREELEAKLVAISEQSGEQNQVEKEDESAQEKQRKELEASQEKKQTSSSFWQLGEEEKKMLDPQLQRIISFIKVLFGFGLAALFLLLIFVIPTSMVSMNQKVWLCLIAIVVALYIWIMLKLRKHNKQEKKKDQKTGKEVHKEIPKESKENRIEQTSKKEQERKKPETTSQILEYSRQLSDLQVKENDLLKEYARQQDLQLRYEEVKKQIEEVEFQTEAIDLAIQTIQELSGDIYDQYGPGLSHRVSTMVSRITEGQYTDVKLDEQLNIKVRKEQRYIGAEFLSTGTLEQIFLAVRLAVAEEMNGAGMPLLLDDIFGAYDDARLQAVLQCLADYPAEQVIIFTAGNRLADALDQTDIDYNYVEI